MTDASCASHIPDAAKVAAQNDLFRRRVCLGVPYAPDQGPPLAGTLVATSAIHAEGPGFVQTCLDRIGAVDSFPAENDPDGYHDFGSVGVSGKTVWFKIDIFDRWERDYGAEAPDDPARTYRVLTILFPSDW